MSISNHYNIGSKIDIVFATTSLSISQTTATAATTMDGATIDRTLLARRYFSVKNAFLASYVAATTAATATISLNFQHSSDGTSWDNYSTGTVPTAVSFGNSTAGTTDYDRVQQSVDLRGARRYVRMQIPAPTYATSSSGQGVFSGMGVMVFGGGNELPATS